MKVDGGFGTSSGFEGLMESCREQEELGYDGLWVPETSHDAFTMLPLMAHATETVELGTSIVVGFARNPMSLAYSANDIQLLSGGRFILGLGSQIRPHITRRFSMEWSKPAARMREMILATKAIWNSWNTGEKLDFRGDFYQHTLMTPFFHPGVNPYGAPRVALAGVGPLMTEVAGETCDMFLCHGFTTEKYLREETIPALERGAARAGRSRDEITISGPSFIVTGNTEEEMDKAKQATKQQVAFYGSTPAYRPVLDCHGWGEMQTELNSMSKEGRWTEMGELVDDDILDAFAVVAEPEAVAAELKRRFDDVVDRVSFYAPYGGDRSRWQTIFNDLKS
ncbi:LLM class F420-dependent oxidoreductase [Candidatus Poriferisodalis sp.]|uniref:LLM class F420-dependent oxidoreductase n=1 Tax=Candidatus Poriferisodalis sp. TaxID=3101277 RepID=UPI003B018D44